MPLVADAFASGSIQVEQQRSSRRLHLSQSFQNTWFPDASWDPVSGEIVHNALSQIDREFFEADWAAATEAIGHQPSAVELAEITRTPAQRRADALVEMATRAMSPGQSAGGSTSRSSNGSCSTAPTGFWR